MRYHRSFTLKELAFESIVDHLDLFICNKDSIPQRHIDFLLRLYSKECFSQYTFSHSKTEECLLWFLSPSNKNVFLPRITQNIMERLQIVGPALSSLTLQGTMATEKVLNSAICCVPHLSYLNLSRTNCSDNTLLCIQKMCPELLTLNVQDCIDVTDDGMINLYCNNLSLKNLNILNTSVEHIGLHDILQHMPSLQCVTYDNMAESFHYIFGSNIQSFIQRNIKYNLTELIFEDPSLTSNPKSVIWTWTVLCPNVEKIHILFPVRQNVLEMCSKFLQLKEFELNAKKYDFNDDDYFEVYDDDDDDNYGYDYFYDGNDDIYSNILDPLAPLLSVAKNLTTLKLSYVKIPSVTLIECFKNVKSLYLNCVTFTDFNKDEIISKSTNLDNLTIKNLHLDKSNATYKFIVLLISLSKNVTELVFSKMSFFPDDLVDVILNSMKSLAFVEFSLIRTQLPSSLFKFFEIPTVQRVFIDGCNDIDLYPFLGPIHFSTDSTTLAWRIMSDIDDDDDEEEDYNDFECDDLCES